MRSEQQTSRRSAPARIPPLAPRRRARHRRVRSPIGADAARREGEGAQGSSDGPWPRCGIAAGDLL